MRLAPVMNLVSEKVHQYVPGKVPLHMIDALHLDDAIQRRSVGRCAPFDQSRIGGALRGSQALRERNGVASTKALRMSGSP